MRLSVLLALLVCPTLGFAQIRFACGELPCIRDEFVNGLVHDAGHAGIAVGVAQGLRLIDSDWNRRDRYLIAAIAEPLAQEFADWLAFHVFEGDWGPPGEGAVYDLLTYQGAWVVPLLQDREWWEAGLVLVAWAGSIYIWNVNEERRRAR